MQTFSFQKEKKFYILLIGRLATATAIVKMRMTTKMIQLMKMITRSCIFFTDRSIYRPGQTVYFKGIVLTKDRKTRKKNCTGIPIVPR